MFEESVTCIAVKEHRHPHIIIVILLLASETDANGVSLASCCDEAAVAFSSSMFLPLVISEDFFAGDSVITSFLHSGRSALCGVALRLYVRGSSVMPMLRFPLLLALVFSGHVCKDVLFVIRFLTSESVAFQFLPMLHLSRRWRRSASCGVV